MLALSPLVIHLRYVSSLMYIRVHKLRWKVQLIERPARFLFLAATLLLDDPVR